MMCLVLRSSQFSQTEKLSELDSSVLNAKKGGHLIIVNKLAVIGYSYEYLIY